MAKRSLYQKGKRDANEPEILEFLRARNVRYTQLAPGDGADLIVWISPMVLIEIKNPEQPPSKRRMTNDEYAACDYCTHNHIPYFVIETMDEISVILDRHFEGLA